MFPKDRERVLVFRYDTNGNGRSPRIELLISALKFRKKLRNLYLRNTCFHDFPIIQVIVSVECFYPDEEIEKHQIKYSFSIFQYLRIWFGILWFIVGPEVHSGPTGKQLSEWLATWKWMMQVTLKSDQFLFCSDPLRNLRFHSHSIWDFQSIVSNEQEWIMISPTNETKKKRNGKKSQFDLNPYPYRN